MRILSLTPTRLAAPGCILAISATALLTAGGCSSATRYYTLSRVESAVPISARAASSAWIGIGPVELPDYVDIPQIVIRTGANTLEQATFDQWGGSLDDMIPRVLVDDLALRLPADHFVSFPQAGDMAVDYRVPVSISQFDVTTTGEAVVVARWQIRGNVGPEAMARGETTARAQADGTSYPQRVAALSKAMGTVADEIAKTLASLPRGNANTSPPRKRGK